MNTPVEQPIHILAVSGSLREASHNRQLLEVARGLVPDGVSFEIFPGLAAVEPFDEDAELPAPAGVEAWRAALRAADGVFIATPEYNASIPGQLKNAFDWASRPEAPDESGVINGIAGSAMYGRPAAVVSSSTGQFGGVWAAAELRKALKTQGARVVDGVELGVGSAASAFTESGELVSADQAERLAELLAKLVDQIQALRSARARAASAAV